MRRRRRNCRACHLSFATKGTMVHFLVEERELEWIHKSFVDRHIIAIHGLGGIGKTRIAVEYIYAYERDYNAIFWANADTNDTLTLSFVAMARQLLDCESRSFAGSTMSVGTGFTSMAHQRNLTDHHGTILTNETEQVVSAVDFMVV
jgi:CO dehydrogenase nickel-insertion accessory protein CooC1